MAAGVPFISYDVGIIKEIINKNHLGFVSNNKSNIIKYINNLSTRVNNKNKIIKIFEKNFEWKIILKNTIKFLKNMNENKIKNYFNKNSNYWERFYIENNNLVEAILVERKIL